jgi:hypothetical protein
MKFCAYCGHENDETALQCRECGTEEFKDSSAASASDEGRGQKFQFADLAPREMQNDLVTLVTCRTLSEADMIVSMLEAAGIPAFVPDQFLMQLAAFSPNEFGVVRVQVSPHSYDAAKELLSARVDDSP